LKLDLILVSSKNALDPSKRMAYPPASLIKQRQQTQGETCSSLLHMRPWFRDFSIAATSSEGVTKRFSSSLQNWMANRHQPMRQRGSVRIWSPACRSLRIPRQSFGKDAVDCNAAMLSACRIGNRRMDAQVVTDQSLPESKRVLRPPGTRDSGSFFCARMLSMAGRWSIQPRLKTRCHVCRGDRRDNANCGRVLTPATAA
jgi:hypothetical protein